MQPELPTDGLEVKQWKTRRKGDLSIWDPRIIRRAIPDSFKKLDPRVQVKNPVMFVVEVGSVVTTVEFVRLLFAQPTAGLDRTHLNFEIFFVLAVAIWLWFTVVFANFAEAMAEGRGKAQADTLRRARTTTLIALLVCLIPTTIGGLLSAIGIAGMDRMVQRNVLAMSGRAVEAAGDVDVLLLDKTGTITLGNRQATRFVPLHGVEEREVAEAAMLSSLSDETPEGRSIVALAKEKYGLTDEIDPSTEFIPFSATTRMSGVDLNSAYNGKAGGRTLSAKEQAARSPPTWRSTADQAATS
jgi:high-affinity K+ transport system ATPase subunit B